VPGATDVVNLPRGPLFDAGAVRAEMASGSDALAPFADGVRHAAKAEAEEPDMVMVDL
jgi:hypothetical protein